MFATGQVPRRDFLIRELVADTSYNGLLKLLNTSAGFDANGFGTSAATSTVFALPIGCRDMMVVATLKFVSPTVAGAEVIGAGARLDAFGGSNVANGIWARLHNGLPKITRFKSTAGAASVLSDLAIGSAFNLPQNTYATITLSAIANLYTATFQSAGINGGVPVSLLAEDDEEATVMAPGLGGVRSLSCSVRASARGVYAL